MAEQTVLEPQKPPRKKKRRHRRSGHSYEDHLDDRYEREYKRPRGGVGTDFRYRETAQPAEIRYLHEQINGLETYGIEATIENNFLKEQAREMSSEYARLYKEYHDYIQNQKIVHGRQGIRLNCVQYYELNSQCDVMTIEVNLKIPSWIYLRWRSVSIRNYLNRIKRLWYSILKVVHLRCRRRIFDRYLRLYSLIIRYWYFRHHPRIEYGIVAAHAVGII